MGRDHPATCRSGQTFVGVHARVNQREGASAVSLLFYVANDTYVEITKWTYIAERLKKGGTYEVNKRMANELIFKLEEAQKYQK
nr:hypothetical protein [Ectobacillus panaciterrae]